MKCPRAVYLHGFASSPASSKARWFGDRLRAEGAEVSVPDLAAGDFEHLTLTGQLSVVERTLEGAAAVLIGSSMGGYLAALYAARHPEIEKVVLLAPAFGFARHWPEALGEEATREWRRTGFLETYHYAEGAKRRIHYGLIEDGLRYEDYPDVGQPVLVFHGRQDAVVPSAVSVEFTARRPNVRLELVDSDHQLLDVLDTIWERTLRFLA